MSARRVRLATWNVLHRVHAENWGEAPLASFPDERRRIEGISAFVTSEIASGTAVMCLQEASGDQLASLRAAAGASVSVFVHRYPRVPKLRVTPASELEDPTEHLVTLVSSPARLVASATFDTDPGKGWLAVELEGGLVVINTHLSSGDRGPAQLALVAATARDLGSPVAVAGDFNTQVDLVRAGLGEGFVLTDLAGQRPTRIATKDRPPRTIDHVAALRCTIASATVLDGGGPSDHQPVRAELVLAQPAVTA